MEKHKLTEFELHQFVLILGLPAEVIKKAAKGNKGACLLVRKSIPKGVIRWK